MAENSYKQSIDQAVNDIGKIEERLGLLAKEIQRVGSLAKENLGALTPKTPADLDKGLAQVKKQLEDIDKAQKKADAEMKKREAALKRQADLQYKFANDKAKAEERAFKEAVKATKIRKQATAEAEKAAAAEAKIKQAREASISKQMTGRMKEYVNSIGKTNDGLRQMRTYYTELEKSTKKVANAEQKAKQAREKAISKQLTGQMKEYVQSIGKTNDGLKKMNAYYKDLEKSSAKDPVARAKQSAMDDQKAVQAKKLLRDASIAERKELKKLQQERKKLSAEQKIWVANAEKEQAVQKRFKGIYGNVGVAIMKVRQEWGLAGSILKEKNKALEKNSQQIQRLTKVNQQEAQATQKIAGAYDRLNKERSEAKKRLQDLIIVKGRSNKQTRQAQKEYDKLTQKINRANGATQNFAKKGLGSAIMGVRNLMGAFGVVGGLYLFADVARQGFNLAKELDSLNYTMEAVIENSEELAQTQQFLSRISEQYGASIVTLTARYNKFYAAAKQSGITMQATEQIFESFTKSAGFLGLQSHELEGVFLALEQMLSKGKVTTEELRRQLGERLPGAFGVMADTVNKLNPDIEVTVSVLDDMLKKGEILSAEVLPEFAKQYEKAIGIEQKERVETLNASVTRLSNAWVEFVGSVTESEGPVSRSLITILNTFTKLIEAVNWLNDATKIAERESYERVLESEAEMYDNLRDSVEKTAQAKIDSSKKVIAQLEEEKAALENSGGSADSIEEVNQKLAEQNAIMGANQKILKESDEEVKANAMNKMKTATTAINSIEAEIKALKDRNKEIKETGNLLTRDWSELGANGNDIDRLERDLAIQEAIRNAAAREVYDHSDYIEEENKRREEQLKLVEEGNSAKETEKEILEGSLAALQAMKSEMEDERDRLETTSEGYAEKGEEIKKVEAEIWKLVSALNALKDQQETYDFDFSMEGTAAGVPDENFDNKFFQDQRDIAQEEIEIEREKQEELEFLRRMGAENAASLYRNMTEEQIGHVEDAMELEKDLMKDLQEAKKDLVFGTIETIADARVEEVEDDIIRNKEHYAEILATEELTEEQRDAIEAERDKKEVALEKKKRKREKEAFLIKQGLALAEIAINLAQTISAINLAAAAIDAITFGIGGQAYRAANIPIAIGTAAAQTGLVLAQAIPKFEKGTDNAPEGLAITNEKRPEVHTDKHGNIKSWGSDKPTLTFTEKGDKIFKSHDDFFSQYDPSDLQKSIWDMNMAASGRELSQSQVDNSLAMEISGLKKSNEKVWREVKKLASRPVNVNNTVELRDNRAY